MAWESCTGASPAATATSDGEVTMEEWGVQAIVGLIVIVVGFAAVIAYPKLQYNAIRQMRGGWRARAAYLDPSRTPRH